MQRWWLPFLVALAASSWVALSPSQSPAILQDSDTRVLLEELKTRNAPLSWFAGDWPLRNHFYRPFPTLTFEADLALHGQRAAGYAQTNALIAAFCTLALFWLTKELTASRLASVFAPTLFAVWQHDWGDYLFSWLIWLRVPIAIFGLWRHGFRLFPVLWAIFALGYLQIEVSGMEALWYRSIGWLPGRTATVMSLFALISLAAYARFERVSGKRALLPAATATDPNTAMREQEPKKGKLPGLWFCVAVAALCCALSSYEQAVMLPAILLIVAIALRSRGVLPHWKLHAVFWVALLAYLGVRWQVLPSSASSYQAQQFRSGPGVLMSLSAYWLPAVNSLRILTDTFSLGWQALFVPAFSSSIALMAANIAGIGAALVRSPIRIATICLWAASGLAFLPMAWLKQFEHYHYLPMALRSIFVFYLGAAVLKLALTAASPPAVQAPRRQSPAPGSLPHPSN